MIRPVLIAAMLLLLPGAASTQQRDDDAIAVDPAKTRIALRYLLAATATPLPPSAHCDVVLKDKPRFTLGEHFAETLSYLDMGANVVAGDCVRDQCRVRISHRGDEEDLSQTEYRFRVARGRMVRGSLGCFGA